MARGLRLLVSQLLFECGAATSPRDEVVPAAPGGLVPQPATRNVSNATELVDAVNDASVGTIIVAAGTYNLTTTRPYNDTWGRVDGVVLCCASAAT